MSSGEIVVPEDEANPYRISIASDDDYEAGTLRIEPPVFVDSNTLNHWSEYTGVSFSSLRVGSAATKLFFYAETISFDIRQSSVIEAVHYVLNDIGDLATSKLIKE